MEIGRIILLKIKTKSGTNGSAITWKALVSYFHQVQNRFSISYIFSTPKNWSDLEFHCSFEVLYVVWNKFPDRKKILYFEKYFFHLEQLFSPFFHTKRQEKFKEYSVRGHSITTWRRWGGQCLFLRRCVPIFARFSKKATKFWRNFPSWFEFYSSSKRKNPLKDLVKFLRPS